MYRCNLLFFVIHAVLVTVTWTAYSALVLTWMWRIRWCVIQIWGWLLRGEVRSGCLVSIKVCCVLIGYYCHDMYLSFLVDLLGLCVYKFLCYCQPLNQKGRHIVTTFHQVLQDAADLVD